MTFAAELRDNRPSRTSGAVLAADARLTGDANRIRKADAEYGRMLSLLVERLRSRPSAE
jgi:hypothetical protein